MLRLHQGETSPAALLSALRLRSLLLVGVRDEVCDGAGKCSGHVCTELSELMSEAL